MNTIQFRIATSVEALRDSLYHQELGRKVCAAFVAQQQGIKVETASKKIDQSIGDLWLLMAEIIRQQCMNEAALAEVAKPPTGAQTGSIQ